ncbi:hypothetical protein RhiirA5_363979, partial [Rhizophagus irregularis]
KFSDKNFRGFHELGIMGKGIFYDILSSKFVNEASHLINKLFNEICGYFYM